MTSSKSILTNVIENLKRQNKMPARIDFSIVGDRYWCVVSDKPIDKLSVINEDVFTGFSEEKEIALLKALSERTERYAFIEGHNNQHVSCFTERSDGFAALPSTFSKDNLRANAFNEAVERFVWSTWWDNSEIYFETAELNADHIKIKNSEYLKTVFSSLDLEFLKVVKPIVQSSEFEVQILIGKIKGKGFISGGACGSIQDSDKTFSRGLDELYRHGFAYLRSIEKNIEASTFYENRLVFFASGRGNSVVEARLEQKGTKNIQLPELAIDSTVETVFEGYQVHRCYFKNQPPFVGGALERLCL
jgi:hypothetical protein